MSRALDQVGKGSPPKPQSGARQLLDVHHVVEQRVKLISRGVCIGLVRRLVDPVLQLGCAGAEVGLGQDPVLAPQQATMAADEPAGPHLPSSPRCQVPSAPPFHQPVTMPRTKLIIVARMTVPKT
jgi:hypothetical protein